MKQKGEVQYCKHHYYGTCRFKENCWKKHGTPREYRQTINCRFHNNGGCKKATSCEFKHQLDSVCSKYNNGHCEKGARCAFRHIKPEKDATKENDNKVTDEIEINRERETKN